MAAALIERTPTTIAIQRLSKLAGAGTSAARIVGTLQTILIDWAAEDLAPAELRERIEILQSDIEAGVMAAQDYVADSDTPKSMEAALNQLQALTALRETLADAIAGRS